MENTGIEIYQGEDGRSLVEVKFENDTVWLNQDQLSLLFERDRTVIGRHIRNVFKEGELSESMVCANFAHTTLHGAIEGKSQTKTTKYYNLDIIISIGYRVKSVRGTQFRQWASQRLKDYLIQGYAINEKRLKQFEKEVKFLRTGIQIVSRAIEEKANGDGFQWLGQYAKGLTLLDDYDHENLDSKGLTHTIVNYPQHQEYKALIDEMKSEFDSDIFGLEKDQSFQSSIAQISKGFGDLDFYPSVEEKAAMLLYLIIKNHSFTDGNKRIAAACFLLFLKQNNILIQKSGNSIISNEALASLTLFVAASNSNEMETSKKLILSILNRNKE